jgi:hypothetical protein
MVIGTATQRGTPLDGLENLLYEKAYLKIVRTWRAEGTWPKMGGYQGCPHLPAGAPIAYSTPGTLSGAC